jgi:hypothetical protein
VTLSLWFREVEMLQLLVLMHAVSAPPELKLLVLQPSVPRFEHPRGGFGHRYLFPSLRPG